MVVTDPVADMLTRIRNANKVYHAEVVMPSSNLKAEIAKILTAEGFLGGFEVTPAKAGQQLKMSLKYAPGRERVITGVRRVSKPGRRVYSGSKDLPRVQGGLGIAVISTSQGVLADREARRRKLGGEVLCEVW
ncbi:MAG: 30S ribosomal protein S8 [Acidimicrobiia bacterium]|nr:30S ribosomal protein S8 [Acidimicrobiia bacterium]